MSTPESGFERPPSERPPSEGATEVSLFQIAGDREETFTMAPASAAIAGAEGPESKFVRFLVAQRYYSRDVAGKLAIAGVDASVKTDTFVLEYEAMVENKPEIVLVNGAEWEKVLAVGVLVQIKVTRFDTQVRADVYSVAAAVKMGMAKAEFTTRVFPADATVLKERVPKDGTLNISEYKTIVDWIGRAKNKLAEIASDLEPQEYYRAARLPVGFTAKLLVTQSMVFGAEMIVRGRKLPWARARARDRNLRSDVVDLIYLYFWPDANDDDRPPKRIRRDAERWLANEQE